jgi:hypothetical protein
MIFVLRIALAAAMASSCFAGSVNLTAGLQVKWDDMSEPMVVNGVEMVIQRATGPDVARLAQRIIATWPVKDLALDVKIPGWNARSHITKRGNEIVQWRVVGPEVELLWSFADLARANRVAARPSFKLPVVCSWTQQVTARVASHSYLQATALCKDQALHVAQAIREELSQSGWAIVSERSAAMHLQREQVFARAVLLPAGIGSAANQSNLVWVQTEELGRVLP